MTRVEFVFEGPERGSAAARPKTIYLAGDRYARIEQFADAESNLKHLIIVNEPDIWLVDAVRKTVGHSVNHGPDLVVHNPILGPDGPEDLLELQYGKEAQFFNSVNAVHVGNEQLNGIPCEVREISSSPFRVRLYVDHNKHVPVEMRAFKDEEPIVHVRYLHYQVDLGFDPTLFAPPKDFAVIEADE